jgi:hypothetical protein
MLDGTGSRTQRYARHEPLIALIAQALGGAAVLIAAVAAYFQFTQQQASHELLFMSQVSKGFEPSPPPALSGVPPQAAAVGYLKRTLGPAVTLNTNWFGLSGANLRQNADGSVTDIGGVPNHWNAHCSTVRGGSGAFYGVAFGGGGYFEATFSWANPPSPGYQNVDGWPAWWATSVEADSFSGIKPLPRGQNLEYDSYEAMNRTDNTEYNAGIIVWPQNFSNNNTGQSGSTHAPQGTDVTKPHRVGFLWVPATANSKGYIKNYFDGVQVGQTYTWDHYAGGKAPNTRGEPTFSIIDVQHFRLWFGTGTKNPMTVYAVNVWQATDANNMRVGVPLP